MDEKFGERTILTRIHKIAERWQQEDRGISIPDMFVSLEDQQSRPTLTIDVAVYNSSDKGKTGYIKQDGWVSFTPRTTILMRRAI